MAFLLDLEGFKRATEDVDLVKNYVLNLDQHDELYNNNINNKDNISIAHTIFKENKITYDTFLNLLSDTRIRKYSTNSKKRTNAKQDLLNEIVQDTTIEDNKDSDIQRINDKVDKCKIQYPPLPFMTYIQRSNELFIRVVTALMNPTHPEFNMEKMINSQLSLSKYKGFKRLASQTADIIENRSIKSKPQEVLCEEKTKGSII